MSKIFSAPGKDELSIFIDKTGVEDYSDPNNPIFGIGGCAIMGQNYEKLENLWVELKKSHFPDFITKSFHTADVRNFSKEQIESIVSFGKEPFYRFFRSGHSNSCRSDNIDGHQLAVWPLTGDIIWLIQRLNPLSVKIFFESSQRGDQLIKKNFNLELINKEVYENCGQVIQLDMQFADKKQMIMGMEVADLTIHTAQRQQKHTLKGRVGFLPDYEEFFIKNKDYVCPGVMFINGIEIGYVISVEPPYQVNKASVRWKIECLGNPKSPKNQFHS